MEFDKAANGIIGLETAFSVVYGLVEEGVLTLTEMVRATSCGPAKAFRLGGGKLSVGSPADIAIFDLERTWTVEPAKLKSKSRNTPWAGKELKGVAVKTILGGVVVYSRD